MTVARFTVSDDPNRAAADSIQVMLRVSRPSTIHGGGQLSFGDDGYLYIGFGDGGPEGDPHNNAQQLDTWLGKILRIDVNAALPYAVPPDNPFVSSGNALPEIWAYGLRNPWRFSFDRLSGDVFIADAGFSHFEELNYLPAASGGGQNFGWHDFEGTLAFAASANNPITFTAPIFEYPHDASCNAIAGGYVYYGTLIPSLYGQYIFGEHCNGQLWALTRTASGDWTRREIWLGGAELKSIAAIVPDEYGEPVLVDIYGGAAYRLLP